MFHTDLFRVIYGSGFFMTDLGQLFFRIAPFVLIFGE